MGGIRQCRIEFFTSKRNTKRETAKRKGTLVFTIPTLITTDSILSYTPYLTYDSYLANEFYYDSSSTTTYHYDELDRISDIVYNNSVGTDTFSQQYTYTYSYNSDGNITKITYSNGK